MTTTNIITNDNRYHHLQLWTFSPPTGAGIPGRGTHRIRNIKWKRCWTNCIRCDRRVAAIQSPRNQVRGWYGTDTRNTNGSNGGAE